MSREKKRVNTICLPVLPHQLVENLEDEGDLMVAGWGDNQTKDNQTASNDVLTYEIVNYKPQDECIELFDNMNKAEPHLKTKMSDSQMCLEGVR